MKKVTAPGLCRSLFCLWSTKKRRFWCLLFCFTFILLIGVALLVTWYAILPAEDPDYNLTPFQSTEETVFISSTELDQYLNSETGATVLDARPRYHKVVERTKAGYGDSIPGSRSAPWRDFIQSDGPGELRSVDELQELFRERGVSNEVPVIVYGSWKEGWGEEGRIYWQLDWLNHTKAFILYGGIFGWNGTGRGVEGRGDFVARPVPERNINAEQLRTRLSNNSVNVIDSRTADEYDGSTPYGSARGGHIPSSVLFNWRRVFEPDESGNLKSPRKLRRELFDLGLARNKPIVVYCTRGIRAGFLYAVLKWIGMESVANFPGSWRLWARNDTLPIEV